MSIGILAAGFWMNLVAVFFVLCGLVLMLVILMQKAKGGGLGSAFGGGGAGGLLGTKTGDFLTWMTIVLAGLFLMLAVVMAKYYRPAVPEAPPAVEQPAEQVPGTGGLDPVLPEDEAEQVPQEAPEQLPEEPQL